MNLILLKLSIFTFFINYYHCNPFKGQLCNFTSGVEGICEPIDKCPTGMNLLMNGTLHPPCGFHGTILIVCCEKENDRIGLNTERNIIRKERLPGDISEQKCKEYSDYVYESRDPVIPIIGAPKIKVYECNIQAIPLVVGGTSADMKEFPHMALIGFPDGKKVTWDCGGIVISEQYILTAAHCAFHPRKRITPNYVAVGFTDKRNFEGQLHKVMETISHPKFNYPVLYHDIGLLKVEKISMNSFVRPACLNNRFEINTEHALATGWGKVGHRGLSNELLKVKLELFNTSHCNSILGEIGKQLEGGVSTETQICAGSTTDIKDTCGGDSGGPLQIFHKESTDGIKCMYDIIGITSFGKKCGVNVGNPGVYTRVSAYIKWIEDIVWPEN